MFRMASNTRPVVATAITQLVEQEKLEYDDLVWTYIPEWDNYRAGLITIGQLLSHSSGLRISSLFLQPLMEPSSEHLQPETVELMTSPKIHVAGEGSEASYYGYGWRLADGTYGHGGSDGTDAWVDPERQIIGLVFTQTPGGRSPLDRFRELVNLSIEEPTYGGADG